VFEGRPPVLWFRCCAPESAIPGDPALPANRLLSSEDFSAVFGVGPPKMYFCHTKETHEYNAVLRTLEGSGLHRTSVRSSKWCLCWSSCPKPEVLRKFHPLQLVNHFPGSWQIGRKDMLWRNVRRMQRKAPLHFDITPPSFVLPDDWRAWELSREQQPGALWIWKPVNSSCGRGIRVLKSTLDAAAEKALSQKKGVVQRYVDKPLLLDGYKFDLRLYVVVTSYDPLKVYLNAEGLVRLATERYSASPQMLHHRTMHLTNYSVNKTATAYVKNLDTAWQGAVVPSSARERRPGNREPKPVEARGSTARGRPEEGTRAAPEGEDPMEESEARSDCEVGDECTEFCRDEGAVSSGEEEPRTEGPGGHPRSSKWSLQQLQEYFASHSLDYGVMMERIKDLIVKTLIAVEPPIVSLCHQGANFQGGSSAQALRGLGPNQTCFEIYGFDVLVDENLTPWLLEVNILPSLSSSSPLDKRIKTRLIAETLTLVGFRPFDHRLVNQALREERESQVCGLQPKVQGLPKSHTIQSLHASSLWDLGQAEWTTILDAHDEFMRRGSLERIFPTKDTGDRYAGLFDSARYANLVLAKWLQEGGENVFRCDVAHRLPPWVPRVISFEPC